jgi:hypothetical protein
MDILRQRRNDFQETKFLSNLAVVTRDETNFVGKMRRATALGTDALFERDSATENLGG